MRRRLILASAALACGALMGSGASGQDATRPADATPQRAQQQQPPTDRFRFGPGGPGGPMGQKRDLVKQFDTNADGRLDKKERDAARAYVKQNRWNEQRFGRGGRGGGPAGLLAPLMIEQADQNGDKSLTKAEFTGLATRWFDRLDPEKTGKVSDSEFADRFAQLLPAPPAPRAGPDGPPDGGGGPRDGRGFGPGGPGGGPGGPFRSPGMPLFMAADATRDDSLTRDELSAAFAKWFTDWDTQKTGLLNEQQIRDGMESIMPRPRFGGPGGPGPGGPGSRQPPQPGPKVAPADVKAYPDSALYEPGVLRTLFLNFEDSDWEAELSELRNSDVEVPATLVVDGKTYPGVGVHFRGMSSLMGVGDGYKRSLNLSMDLVDKKQRLNGYHTLNLLNAHEDPSFLHTILYSWAARKHLPAPKANFVKVVINGESWGVYVNVEQFNKEMLREWFPDADGPRWKVRGSPGGRGGMEFLGENPDSYKQIYSIKSKDMPKAWESLIQLFRTLNQTPPDKLEEALTPMLDVDGVLWFLALENAFVNDDGYWTRASDYTLYQDSTGKFHIVPHDMNEAFQRGGGGPGGPPMAPRAPRGDARPGDARPGGGDGPDRGPDGARGPGGNEFRRRGPGGGGGPNRGIELDPLVGLDDSSKPLRSKLLAVPALRTRYLQFVRTLADEALDWNKLQPIVKGYRELIDQEVKADTRKLESYEAFAAAVSDNPPAEPAQNEGPGPRRAPMALRQFMDQRRAFLLKRLGELEASVPAVPKPDAKQ